jgi:hypothetical protein
LRIVGCRSDRGFVDRGLVALPVDAGAPVTNRQSAILKSFTIHNSSIFNQRSALINLQSSIIN